MLFVWRLAAIFRSFRYFCADIDFIERARLQYFFNASVIPTISARKSSLSQHFLRNATFSVCICSARTSASEFKLAVAS